MRRIVLALALLILPSTLWAEPPLPPNNIFGGKAAETWQNWYANKMNLITIKNRFEFEYLVQSSYLVPLPELSCIDVRLFDEWRYTMPHVVQEAQKIDKDFSDKFGELCYYYGSAARTHDKQLEIILGTGTKENGNYRPNKAAAAADGPRASLHLRGAAIDINKLWLPDYAVSWLRNYFKRVQDQYHVYVTEEWGVFHVVVFPDNAIRPIFTD